MEPILVTPRESLGLDNAHPSSSRVFEYNAPHVVYPPSSLGSSRSTNEAALLAVCVFGTGTRPDQSSMYLRCLHELTGLPTIGLSYEVWSYIRC